LEKNRRFTKSAADGKKADLTSVSDSFGRPQPSQLAVAVLEKQQENDDFCRISITFDIAITVSKNRSRGSLMKNINEKRV